MRGRWGAVSSSLIAFACAGREPAPLAPDDGSEVAPTAMPTAEPARRAAAAADSVVASALATVERRRELRSKGAIKGRTIERAEMVAFVKKQLADEIPAPIVRAQTELLFALGVVPENFDYEESLLELMGTQLAGFYDPKQKTMFLSRDLPPLEREATLAHELVHALQDQHYDLEKLIKFREDATDQQSALHALAEGDATSAMLDHVLAVRGLRATDVSDEAVALEVRGSIELSAAAVNVPTILKRSVVSPYVDGLIFVNGLRRRGGWAGVDAVWRDPPATTEQLLHPEKHAKREAAEQVPLPAAPRGGPTEVMYRDVLGEQSLRLLFEEWMPRRAAVESAADWAGDRMVLFRAGERFALVWHTRWDDEKSALRGTQAFARGVLRPKDAKPGEFVALDRARAALKRDRACTERAAQGPIAVARSGRDVTMVAGPFERTASGARSAGTCAEALVWAVAVAKQR